MRGFVISWFFPPINSSEGLVTFKLLKNSKYDYDVYTQKNNLVWTYKTNEDKLKSENINTVFSKADNYVDWIEEGVKYFSDNKEKYDFIMSRSMPPDSHTLALRIKKQYPNIKWIASFGDPIDNNPFETLLEEKSPYSVKGVSLSVLPIRSLFSPKRIIKNAIWKISRKRYLKSLKKNNHNLGVQEETIKNADVLIFNNEYQKEYMIGKYGEEISKKAIIIPHTFDKDFYEEVEKNSENNKIKITYVGHLDNIRKATSFLKALNRLNENEEDLASKLEVKFYGNMADVDKVYIVDHELYSFVNVKKPVDYLTSLRIMKEADWLLLVDANLGNILNENIFFAAKLADYLGSGNRIFGITMLEGASASIIRETGGLLASHSVDEIYMYLKMILDKKLDITMKNLSNYDIANVVKKYDEKVDEVLS